MRPGSEYYIPRNPSRPDYDPVGKLPSDDAPVYFRPTMTQVVTVAQRVARHAKGDPAVVRELLQCIGIEPDVSNRLGIEHK